MTPEEQARIATRIGEIEHALSKQYIVLQELDQSVATARRSQRAALQSRVVEERQVLTQMREEANRLRAQIGLPLVVRTPDAPVATLPVPKRRGRGCLFVWLAIGACVLVGGCLVLLIALVPTPPRSHQSTSPRTYVPVDVRDLTKNPEKYNGTALILTGTVFHISEESGRTRLQMWVAAPGGSDLDRQPVVVLYDSTLPGVFEQTAITVSGVGAGTSSGTNAFGATLDQPVIQADSIKH